MGRGGVPTRPRARAQGAHGSAEAAAVRSEDRALGDGHSALHVNPQTRRSLRHNLKHVVARPVKQLGVLATQPGVQHSCPFGQEPPNPIVPPCCSEEGGQSSGASRVCKHVSVPRVRESERSSRPRRPPYNPVDARGTARANRRAGETGGGGEGRTAFVYYDDLNKQA